MMFFCEKILERLQEQYLAFLVEIACQTFILLRISQNNQTFGLFREIDVVFEKMLIFLQNRQTWHFYPSLRFKKYNCARGLKTFKFLKFPGKEIGHLEKLTKLFENCWNWLYFFRMRLKSYFRLKFLKTFSLWVSLEKQVGSFGKETWIFFKIM